MASAVHQVMGVFAERDAVGCHTLALRDALRRRGVESRIFAEDVAAGSEQAHPIDELVARPDDGSTVLIYQASTFAEAAEVCAARGEPLVVNYHNITPARFFARWEPTTTAELAAARCQVAQLASRATLAIADSTYNAHELIDMGYHHVEVAPVLIDLDRMRAPRARSAWPDRPGARWLFVGRIAPNKAQHEVVKAFAVFRRLFDRQAVLALPGRSSSHSYQVAVDALITSLGLDDAVMRPGSVADEDLAALYRDADVFVCLSEHEGFCNTVVEAMAFGVPVVANSAAALPETVGDAAVVLHRPSSAVVAAAVHRVTSDPRVRDALVAAGYRRQQRFDLGRSAERACDLVLEAGR
jgi:L-malate glycosyltransferase